MIAGDLALIRLLLERTDFDEYSNFIKARVIQPIAKEIIDDITAYYDAKPDEDSVEPAQFAAWCRLIRHPTWDQEKTEMREEIIGKAAKVSKSPDVIERMLRLNTVGHIEETLEKFRDGGSISDLDKVAEYVDKYHDQTSTLSGDHIVPIDPSIVEQELLQGDGVEWSMDLLNKSVGQLHPTDVVLITKRPETGGTSFMIHQMVHMLHQLPKDKNIILFHNEEGPQKVAGRIIQSALGVSTKDWLADPKKVEQDWKKWLGTRKITLFAKSGITTHDIMKAAKSGEYFLIGINVIEKVENPLWYKLDETSRLTKLGDFMRQVAMQGTAVMAVTQAPKDAEDRKWLQQHHVFNSTTKLPSESDIMFGIGRESDPSPGEEDYRYVKVIRNKKPLTGKMEKRYKYAAIVTEMDTETGRYVEK